MFISPQAEADGKVPGSAVVSLRIFLRHSTSEGHEPTKSLTSWSKSSVAQIPFIHSFTSSLTFLLLALSSAFFPPVSWVHIQDVAERDVLLQAGVFPSQLGIRPQYKSYADRCLLLHYFPCFIARPLHHCSRRGFFLFAVHPNSCKIETDSRERNKCSLSAFVRVPWLMGRRIPKPVEQTMSRMMQQTVMHLSVTSASPFV